MKKSIFLASLISLPLSFSSYAFDVSSYLNQKISNDFRDQKQI